MAKAPKLTTGGMTKIVFGKKRMGKQNKSHNKRNKKEKNYRGQGR